MKNKKKNTMYLYLKVNSAADVISALMFDTEIKFIPGLLLSFNHYKAKLISFTSFDEL